MSSIREGKPSVLGDFHVVVTRDFFTSTAFRMNTVNTMTFILLLGQQDPLNFVSGQPIALDMVLRNYNRSEFHHLYPRAFLTATGVPAAEQGVLANFCFLSKADNTTLGGVAPSVYRSKMADDTDQILQRALCPPSLFDDDFPQFLIERGALLEAAAEAVMV